MIILSTHGFVCVNSTRALDVWRKEEKEYLLCHCGGFAYHGAQALGTQTAIVAGAHGLHRCGSQALEHGLCSHGAQT